MPALLTPPAAPHRPVSVAVPVLIRAVHVCRREHVLLCGGGEPVVLLCIEAGLVEGSIGKAVRAGVVVLHRVVVEVVGAVVHMGAGCVGGVAVVGCGRVTAKGCGGCCCLLARSMAPGRTVVVVVVVGLGVLCTVRERYERSA